MSESDILLIVRGIIAAVFALWVIAYYLLLITSRKYLSSKSFFTLGTIVFVSVLIQTLSNIFINNDYLSIIFICGEGLISIVAFFVVFASTPIIFRNQQTAQQFSVVVVIALLFNLIIPIYLSDWIMNKCDSDHRELAVPIINAVNEYKVDNNEYPTDLNLLIPKYISDIPVPSCFLVYHPFISKLTQPDFLRSVDYELMMKLSKLQKIDYYVVNNEWDEDGVHYEEYYLYVLKFNLNKFQRYNILTKTWETIPDDY
jgi:hypothetical protein